MYLYSKDFHKYNFSKYPCIFFKNVNFFSYFFLTTPNSFHIFCEIVYRSELNKKNLSIKSIENCKIIANRHTLPSLLSTAVYTFPLFFSYQAKIGFQKLFRTFFRIIISFLEAEIHRFFMLQLSWYTLYVAALLPI